MSSDVKTQRWREAVRQEWQEASRATAWRKWYPEFVVMSRGATQAIVEEAHVAPGMDVLDLASGTGEPALTLARAVGPNGRVTATDLVPGMLATAQEKAREHGLANLRFGHADAEALPFADTSFDRVTCRFGVMFFPDVAQALREIRRVLRPGGRAAFAAWGPLDQNPYFKIPTDIVAKYAEIPPVEPGAPTPFRFAEPGSLSAVLREAGFGDVREEARRIPWTWPGPVEQAWEARRELSPIMERLVASLPPETRAQVGAEVCAALRPHSDGKQVSLSAVIVVASAAR